MKHFFLFLLPGLFFLFNAQAKTSLSEKQLTNISRQLERIRSENNISAALLMIVDKDNIVLQHHSGTVDWNQRTPFAAHHQFRIGSISKTFAGLLALRLQQQGLIELRDTFESYVNHSPIRLPKNSSNINQPITLAHLLEHTAGLTDMQKPEWDYNAAEPISLTQAFALKKGSPTVKWPVGFHSSYSNVGTGLFGLALEQHFDTTYEKLIDQHVFAPMHMNSTALLLSAEIKSHLITGYNSNGTTPIPYWHILYRPAAAINTNANDMAIFLQMILNQGQIGSATLLKPSHILRWTKPTTTLAAQSGLNYGYGLGLYQWQRHGYSFYGHGGDADGYLTHFGVNHDSGLAYLVMINAFQKRPLQLIRSQVERLITNTLKPAQASSAVQLSTQQLKRYAGRYEKVTYRFNQPPSNKKNQLLISMDQGQLILHLKENKSVPLLATNTSHFRRTDQTVATMAFIEKGNNMYFQSDWGNFIKIKKKNSDE